MYEILFDVVCAAAVARSSWLLVGLARMIPVHASARTRKWGVVEGLAVGEIFVFLPLTWLLLTNPPPTPPPTATSWLTGVLGAGLAVLGVAVSVWAITTTVRLGIVLDGGHFVKREHPLITTGAYGLVRNPMYLGILLLWLGIALAYQHALLGLATLALVPVFLLYIRSEDRMLAAEFGEPYAEYRRRVGSLLPRMVARRT